MKKIQRSFATALSLTALLMVTNCKTTEMPVAGPAIDSLSGKHTAMEERLSTAAAHAIAAGKINEALVHYERLYRNNEFDRDVVLNYAQLLRKSGKAERALEVLAPFLDTRTRRRLKSTAIDPVVLNEYAAANIVMGNFEAADAALKRVLGDENAVNVYADAYNLRGIILDAEGRHKEAEPFFRRALEGWKGDKTSVMNNLGLNLASQGLFDESLMTLRQALVVTPQKEEIARNIQMVTALRNSLTPTAPVLLQK